MDLNTLWFILISVLFTGFFVLEGFDFGVGMLLPFIGKDDMRRRVMLNTIGPHWDGNEVWLITAGGAMFAAFPNWYATLFSGFYLALFLLLLALIVRGAGIEFRSLNQNSAWRRGWDWAITVSSLAAPLLLGVALTNIVAGVPIDEKMNYVGGFWNLLNPYALLGGVTFVTLFAYHGMVFLALKVDADLAESVRQTASRLWLPAVIALGLFAGSTFFVVKPNAVLFIIPAGLAAVSIVLAGWLMHTSRTGRAFIATTLTIVFVSASLFLTLYPNVMVSSLNAAWSLTIYTAAASPYTLGIMSVVALVGVPLVLLYQGWSYWVFRKRLESKPETLIY